MRSYVSVCLSWKFVSCLKSLLWCVRLIGRMLDSSWREREVLKWNHFVPRAKRRARFWIFCSLEMLVGAARERASGQ